jgi:hypothetical protein
MRNIPFKKREDVYGLRRTRRSSPPSPSQDSSREGKLVEHPHQVRVPRSSGQGVHAARSDLSSCNPDRTGHVLSPALPSGIPLSSFWKQGGWGRLDADSKTPPPYPRTFSPVTPLGRESQRWTASEESPVSLVWRAIRSTPDRVTFLSLKRSGRPVDCFGSPKSSFKISMLSIPKRSLLKVMHRDAAGRLFHLTCVKGTAS